MWVELDGNDIVINTALGRAQARNFASDSRVAVSLIDPADCADCVACAVCVTVRGIVVGFATVGADEVIDRLAKKYLDAYSYSYRLAATARFA